jgi:hypothetical protein
MRMSQILLTKLTHLQNNNNLINKPQVRDHDNLFKESRS